MTQISTGQYGVALYYPRIAIRSPGWVFGNLLLWDSIRRIVPYGAPCEDHAAVALLAKEGLVQDTAPIPDTDAAEARFFGLLDQADESGVTLAESLRSDPVLRNRPSLDLHTDKMSYGVRERLRHEGFVFQRTEEWLAIEGAVAGLYMACLASVMSERLGAPLTTDELPFLGWASLFGVDRGASSDPLLPVLATLQIDWPDPASLSQIKPSKFLRFHERRTPERVGFREALLAMQRDLSAVKDVDQLADAAASHARRVQGALRDARRAQNELGIRSFVSSLDFACPTFLGLLTGAITVNPVIGAVVGGVGLALNFARWAAETCGEHRAVRRDNPMYYAMAVTTELV